MKRLWIRFLIPFLLQRRQGKGTGLGLATVFGIVKQNEGNILVDSIPGKGTAFKVYWPYSEVELVADNQTDTKVNNVIGKERVLIAEDDPKVRGFTKEALESFGYKVIEASNGIEALNSLKKNSKEINLLISDVIMPEMGGQELVEEVKQNYPDLKVILVSGYTDSQIIREGAREHSVNFIYKPFSIQTLMKKVREVLDNS